MPCRAISKSSPAHVAPCHAMLCPAQPSHAMPCTRAAANSRSTLLLAPAGGLNVLIQRKVRAPMGIPGRAWDAHASLNIALPCRAYIAIPHSNACIACHHVCRKHPFMLTHAPSHPSLQTLAETAKAAGKSEADTAALLAACREKLFSVRAQRPRPHRDEKVGSAARAVCCRAGTACSSALAVPHAALTPSLTPACAPHRLCRRGRACPFRPLPPPPACCPMSSRPLAGSSQWRAATQRSIWRQRSRCRGCVAWVSGTCLLLWFGLPSG